MKPKHLVLAILLLPMCITQTALGQCSLSGNVKDPQGNALPFAVVQLKHSSYSVQCDASGHFVFKGISCKTQTLIVACVGYLSVEDTVNVSQGKVFDPVLQSSNKSLEEIVVQSTRVDKDKGMAYSNMNAEQIKNSNLGQDVPFVLNQLTGVVASSDAGNGIGYTGLRIRGSDGTRINITLNGVPMNDAESQISYFVDFPDLLSSINSVQVQRGVGSSCNGAGAFGATVNFETKGLKEKPYAGLVSTAGSFNTYRNTLTAGSGLMNGKFAVDARVSLIKSDGYIDRASSDLKSYFLSAAYYHKKSVLKFINFYGQEKTYQSWYYVPEDSIKSGNRRYNMAGEYIDAEGKLQYYSNQTDNYRQNNFQLHFIHQFSSRLHLNLTAHYTKGKGYYEQYRVGETLSDYGIDPAISPGGDTVITSDLIRRLWLDNDFAGGIFNLNYRAGTKLQFILGGGFSSYLVNHFDKLSWTQYNNAFLDQEYNRNKAEKRDANLYVKANYKPFLSLNIFGDMQVRQVQYSFLGFDDSLQQKMQNVSYVFYNPKIGVSYDLTSNINIYSSLSVGNKEPNRDDFVQSSPQSRPKSEQLTDLEAGIRFRDDRFDAGLNLYNMQYKNQLVLNGQINNVGAYNRVNVPESYRKGIEADLTYRPLKYLEFSANLAVSRNKIKEYSEYIDSSSVDYSVFVQKEVHYSNTDIAFSPGSVSSLILSLMPVRGIKISLISKNVSRQFLDNTSSRERSINPYELLDLNLSYTTHTKLIPELGFKFVIYNVLNKKYETNGYTYSAYYGSSQLSSSNNLATAAGTNFLAGISIKF